MKIFTERLVLRPWKDSDATDLYHFAKDKRVGPVAGWPAHKSVEESAEVIRTVFSQEGVYAITLKGEDVAIGCVGLIIGANSNFELPDTEAEISYWIGVPYWGKGYVPEACKAILRGAFEVLNVDKVWCGFFQDNLQSKRAQEKCGFIYDHTLVDLYVNLLDEVRTEEVYCLTKERWSLMQ